jgi:hypothetical protein
MIIKMLARRGFDVPNPGSSRVVGCGFGFSLDVRHCLLPGLEIRHLVTLTYRIWPGGARHLEGSLTAEKIFSQSR